MELPEILDDIGGAILALDAARNKFRDFQPGVGPFGEPQLVKLIAAHLNAIPKYRGQVHTRRCPDLLIPSEWAIEFKIARPYGDNGKEAENWSVNLLHPYRGNVSSVGDCYKLLDLEIPERKAVLVIGYEHNPPQIDLTPLIESFEAVAQNVAHIRLGPRVEKRHDGLIHPVHQSVRLFAWEVLPHYAGTRKCGKMWKHAGTAGTFPKVRRVAQVWIERIRGCTKFHVLLSMVGYYRFHKSKAPLVGRGIKRCQLARYLSSAFIIPLDFAPSSRAEDDGLEP